LSAAGTSDADTAQDCEATTTWDQRPAADEFEVTLLGPGYGESVIVHVGCGAWLLVDSCIGGTAALESGAALSSLPEAHPALAYLLQLGVDLLDVTYVVATHWHDDHVRGLERLVAHCERSVLVISTVMTQDEVLGGLLGVRPLNAPGQTNGVESMRRALALVARTPSRLMVHHEGVSLPGLPEASGRRVSVQLLAPSTSSFLQAQGELGKLLDKQRRGSGVTVPSPRRNKSSIALWVRATQDSTNGGDPVCLLLGGDVEIGTAEDRGWRGVHASPHRVVGERASLVKVAHHGSRSAHHEAVWRDMTRRPLAMLTPWNRGPEGLPTPEGLASLHEHASAVLSTAALPVRIKRRLGGVRRTRSLSYGRVTARVRLAHLEQTWQPISGHNWRVNVVHPARYV